jgi:WXXGXW repeat (2 copies)
MREQFDFVTSSLSPNSSETFDSARKGWLSVAQGTSKVGRVAARMIGVAMLAVVMLEAPAASQARVSVGIAVSFGPPALPIYYQPPCPGYGYIWTPGYWAWDPDYGYYWVPGTWVDAPFEGALWTPGYWAFGDGVYIWNEGYWGPVVGYYGGINYGFGYTGYGYEGGYWQRNHFYYNRTVNNVSSTNITYVYNKTVVNNTNGTRVSYNGGPDGTRAHPSSAQLAAARERRHGPVASQERQMQIAQSNPQQRARINHGRPSVAATARPGAFSGGEAVQATRAGAPYRPPKEMPQSRGTQRSMPAAPPAHEHGNPRELRQSRGAERSMPAARPAPKREARPRVERTTPPRHEHVQPNNRRNEPPPQQSHANVERQRTERQPSPRAETRRAPERGQAERSNRSQARSERPHKPGPPHGR